LTPRLLVIDTQSLFDWLVFHDHACDAWPRAFASGRWQWIYTEPMRAEFDHVAARGFGARWPVPVEQVARAWAEFGRAVADPGSLAEAVRLHCTDPDDQKFIDLAIAAGGHTLLSRDKALLRLSRRARERHGLVIRAPAGWDPDQD
jgi:hypothetical protein